MKKSEFDRMGSGESYGNWGRIQTMSGMNIQGDSGDFYVGGPRIADTGWRRFSRC